ncbi:MAG: SMP-30/gluconolactonase/LRE family protein [Gammaproteobacteria bacterium]|jgi:sugar lactone lactonase YvrE
MITRDEPAAGIGQPAEGAARSVWESRAILGEGPLWVARENAVYWTDIKGYKLHRLTLDGFRHTCWEMPDMLCWILERHNGRGFMAGFRTGVARLQLAPFGIEPIATPEPDLPHNRMNDAAVDPNGRIWAGTMDERELAASGSLYRLDPDGRFSCHDTGYIVSNGPTFSPDHTHLYHADTARGVIYRFELGADGSLAGRGIFVDFPPGWGSPDGMASDRDGGIWVAHWGGGRVSRFLPDGRLDRALALPVSQVTSCCFAGADLDRMFVTTAAIGRDNEPLAGNLFEVDPGVCGAPCFAYAG